jgi:hypothetical protein
LLPGSWAVSPALSLLLLCLWLSCFPYFYLL